MRNSDIFDEYAKLALEKGLISKAEKEESKKSKDSISNIEALYGLNPEISKELKYKKNIMESAHPEPAVSFLTYDKLNALVENNNERQNIILNIINKSPDGKLFNKKYAADQELLLSLVRLANYLDNKNENDLRLLADSCTYSLSSSIKKKALGPVGLVIGLTASLLGFIYANQHLPNANHGYEKNYALLIKEINDLINSEKSWGVGYELDDNLKKDMITFKNYLEEFNKLYLWVKPYFTSLEIPRTAQELTEMAKQPETDELIKAYNQFKSMAENLVPFTKKISDNFKSSTYKDRHIKDKGLLTSVVDYVKLHGGKNLIADDFDDIVMAIPPFYESINEILTVLREAENFKNQALKSLEEAKSENPFKDAEPYKAKVNTFSDKTKTDDINNPENLEKELESGLF